MGMHKLLSACILAVVIMLALLTLSGCGEQIGTVQGTVTQMRDPNGSAEDPANIGPPIRRATVAVYSLERFSDVKEIEVYDKGPIVQKMLTDAAGAYSFSLPKDKYIIEVWVDGLTVASRQVKVEGGKTTDLNFNVPATP
jgi:hypothetical protein